MALSPKQQKALELLTCGQGLTYGEIARQVGCDVSTLRDWRNGEGFQEFKSELKRLNDILILPTDARAEWLTKNSTDTQVENILKRTHDSIYRIAKCPDFSSETFVGGVSSGVAIRYRLTGCETKASAIESNMKKALQRRVELIAGVASLTLGEDVFRDIQITFTRNIPSDNTDVVNLVQALQGVVSNKTLLSMIPQVNDVDAEIEALEQERNEKIKIYDFEPANNVDE